MREVYNRPYCSSGQLIDHLKSKGLSIEDEPSVHDFLNKVNYYRFKVYLRPFRTVLVKTLKITTEVLTEVITESTDNDTEEVITTTTTESTSNIQEKKKYNYDGTFEEGIELYRFDDELRDVLFSLTGRIEVKLRSMLDQMICARTDDPYWYLNDDFFTKGGVRQVQRIRDKLRNDVFKSTEKFIENYLEHHHNDVSHAYGVLPPFWMVAELLTFGQVLNLYTCLDKKKFENPKAEIAALYKKGIKKNINDLDGLTEQFGAFSIKELADWLYLIRDIRNRSAHHGRTFNSNFRGLTTPRKVNKMEDSRPSRSNRLYSGVIVMELMRQNLSIDINFKGVLVGLFEKYPTSKRFLKSMGFPDDWENTSFWNS